MPTVMRIAPYRFHFYRRENMAKRFFARKVPSMAGGEASKATVALRCWVDGRRVWVELADQRLVSFPAAKYARLAEAPQELLEKVQLRVQGRALRWEELDEDIWVDDAVHGRFPVAKSAAA